MITSFRGEHAFLSNFAQCASFVFEGAPYHTVEHAYQAAKTLDQEERMQIRMAPTAAEAKRLGRRVTMRPDWDSIKLDVMRQLVALKFSNDIWREKLFNTGDQPLIEGNTWGDRYWGMCGGTGHNHLGRILMDLRNTIKQEQS